MYKLSSLYIQYIQVHIECRFHQQKRNGHRNISQHKLKLSLLFAYKVEELKLSYIDCKNLLMYKTSIQLDKACILLLLLS